MISSNVLKYTKTDEPIPDLPSSAGNSSGTSSGTSSAAGIESVTAAAAVPVTESGIGIDAMTNTSKNALVVSTKQAPVVICNFGTKPVLGADGGLGTGTGTGTGLGPGADGGRAADLGPEAELPSGLLLVNKHDSKKRNSMDGNKMVEVIDLFTPEASTAGTPTIDLSPATISPRTQSTIDAANEVLKRLEEQAADHKKELDAIWAANKQSEALAKARHEETLAAAVENKKEIIAAVRVGTQEVVNKVETEGEKNRLILSNQITKADRTRAAEQRAKDAEEQKVQFQLKEESDAKEAERKKESNAKEAELKKKIEEVEAETKAVHAQAIKAVREEKESTRRELWMAIDALEERIEEKLVVLAADSTEANRASIEALKAECLKKKDEASTIGDFLKSTLQGFHDAASEIFNQNKLAAISEKPIPEKPKPIGE